MTLQKERKIRSPVQLLVEGNDPRNFFTAFTKFLEINDYVQIQNFGGTGELQNFLLAFRDQMGFKDIVRRIGIIRDAELDFDAAFSSVRSSLGNAKFPIPESHAIFTTSVPSVGAMILPGENQSGMLETLLCRTISGHAINVALMFF